MATSPSETRVGTAHFSPSGNTPLYEKIHIHEPNSTSSSGTGVTCEHDVTDLRRVSTKTNVQSMVMVTNSMGEALSTG